MVNLLQSLRTRVGRSLAYGRQPTPRPRPYQEMGVSGTAVWGGYVQVKERSPEWIGRQKWITASELAVNTSIVAAGVHYFLNLVAYPKWTIRPTDDKDEESLAMAEFTDHVLNHMDSPWYRVVRRAAMYRFYGFGIQEWTAKHRDDGLVGFKDIEARPQHTIEQWDVDIDGTVMGMWQRSPQTGHMLGLPRDKVLYLVEDTLTDNPEGIGMFRHMADPYKRLKQLQELEIRAYERDLRGIPIARAPLTFINRAIKQGVITQADADKTLNDMRSMVELQVKQSDTGLVLDSLPYFSDSDAGDQVSGVPQWGFELLSGAGVGHAEIAAAIDRVQREIARIIGVEHLMMGDVGGNRSLSEDKSRNLYLIANSVLKYIASQVKSDIVVPLWHLNGFPMDKLPTVETEDVTFKNADAITGALHRMASAGAPLAPNDPVINDVRDLLGIKRVPEDIMAQGATPPPNPALAGLPPELQLAMMGGKGGKGIQLPGKTPGFPGGLGAGGPGKQPGMGGGALPGQGGFDPTKKAAKARGYLAEQLGVEDENPEETLLVDEEGNPVQPQPASQLEEPDQPTRNGFAVAQPKRTKPNGRSSSERLPSSVDSLNGPSDTEPQGQEAPRDQEPEDVGGEPLAQQGQLAESPTEAPVIDPRAIDVKSGGKVEVDASLLVRLLERFAGGPAEGQPTAPGGPTRPAATALDALKPTAAQPGNPQGAAVDGKDTALEGEPGQVALPDAKPTNTTAGGALEGKPPADVQGQPAQPPQPQIDPKTGQPIDPAAQGLPGAQPPPPKEEMDIEQASGILQPYAGGNPAPGMDQEESQTESDELYDRLGQEKDVEAATSDQLDPQLDPTVEVEGAGLDKPLLSAVGGGKTTQEPVVRERLPQPQAKPAQAKPGSAHGFIPPGQQPDEELDQGKPPFKRPRPGKRIGNGKARGAIKRAALFSAVRAKGVS